MPNLNDYGRWIEDLQRQVARLKSGAFLENSSISYGRMRFIGGLLLIDSGGTLQVIGHLNGDGDFVWSGPWAFTGDGEITGDVALTGNLEVLDDGTIKVGNIELRDGKVFVGTGASQIVIDGATGRIIAGNLTIDPNSNGGEITFGDGRTINASSTGIGIYDGDRFVVFNTTGVTMYADGRSISVGVDGIQVLGIPTVPQADVPGSFPSAIIRDSSGFLAEIEI